MTALQSGSQNWRGNRTAPDRAIAHLHTVISTANGVGAAQQRPDQRLPEAGSHHPFHSGAKSGLNLEDLTKMDLAQIEPIIHT